jgi:hypothetical protein
MVQPLALRFSPDRRRFGLARMQAYFQSSPPISSRRQVRLFLRALRDFAAGEPQHDDITVLIAIAWSSPCMGPIQDCDSYVQP